MSSSLPTTIEELHIEHLDNKPPKFKKLVYPVANKANIPSPYFVSCLCATRGQGKTTMCVKMLQAQEKAGFMNKDTGKPVAIRHILYTSSLQGNPIWSSLKFLADEDIHEEYSHKHLDDLLESLKKDRLYTEEFQKYVIAYNTFKKMTPEQFEKWKDNEAIVLLMKFDYTHPDHMEQPRHPNGVITNIVFDDMLASPAFQRNRQSSLIKLCVNGRHYQSNCFILSQHIKTIPNAIRQNTEVWFFWRFKSRKIIIDHVFEHFGNLVSEEDFIKIYDYATTEEHDCLMIDMKEPNPAHRFKKNMDTILLLK